MLVGSLSVSGIERWFGVGSFFGPGIVVAVVLVAALAVVLPRAQRGRVAAPLVLIGLHVLLELVVLLLPKGAFLSRTLEVLGVFLLALALGRSAFLLVVDGVLSARLGRSIPRIFRDVIQSCVYLAAGRAGSLFGEMSLMTGEPRAASVQAMTETEVLVVGKDIFAEIVATDADAIERMTRIRAERQDQLETHLAARATKSDALVIEERTNALPGRVRDFFKMR